MKILHRFSGATLFESGHATMRETLVAAVKARADLAGADLAGAKNVPAVDTEAPTEPYERKPSAERYAERAARFRERNPQVPFVESLDAKILGVIESGVGKLDMSNWHQCQTTHCRAGWAITLAGPAGKDLDDLHGLERAGAMIYRASTGRVPHFFAVRVVMKRYDSMGFESEHGIWVRAVDADERIQALQAELAQWRTGSARVNGALLARIEALEACVLEYWRAKDWDEVGAADAAAAKLLPADMKARATRSKSKTP